MGNLMMERAHFKAGLNLETRLIVTLSGPVQHLRANSNDVIFVTFSSLTLHCTNIDRQGVSNQAKSTTRFRDFMFQDCNKISRL